MMYSVIQTGANTQLGGLKLGKIISEYHGSLNEEVIKLPIADAVKVIKINTNRDKYLFLVIVYLLFIKKNLSDNIKYLFFYRKYILYNFHKICNYC
tara:strand:- start:397 stop:684 length:288 start_codon:yes stop_codon:yes gene_type:complete